MYKLNKIKDSKNSQCGWTSEMDVSDEKGINRIVDVSRVDIVKA